jgi:hypothetical protein
VRRRGAGPHELTLPRLDNVLWIGGVPAAGKSTLAKRLARRHGLRWYSADAHTWEHRDRAIREGHAGAIRWEAMTHEERWVTSTPAEMLELSIDFDRWRMIADDVAALPPAPLIVAEGSTVLPELVAAGIADRACAVWLQPTPELQRARRPSWLRGNALEFAIVLAAEIARRVQEHDVQGLRVDGSQPVETVLASVEGLFAARLAAGPRAATHAERRALLRAANEASVDQALAYLARPWSRGTAESFVREFACECDDPECASVVELPVADFPRASYVPLVAAGHQMASACRVMREPPASVTAPTG